MFFIFFRAFSLFGLDIFSLLKNAINSGSRAFICLSNLVCAAAPRGADGAPRQDDPASDICDPGTGGGNPDICEPSVETGGAPPM